MNRKLENQELGRMNKETFRLSNKNKIKVVLDNVRSLHNVGSVFRTCDAFLVEELLLCGLTGTPPNREMEKTALGATETVGWKHFKDTISAINYLKENKYRVYAVEQAEYKIHLHEMSFSKDPVAFVFGNEVYGVDQIVVDACDGVLEIPQFGSKHSLNVAVSAGIVLWEALRKISL